MADAASPAARPILARGPAGWPLSAPSPPTLASVPERLHAHGKAGLSPPAPRPRVLEPTFPPLCRPGLSSRASPCLRPRGRPSARDRVSVG